MATIDGTNDPETLNGTAGDDVINGLDGDDTLNGLGANDILNGGDDNDSLNGGDGNDTANGESGDDTITVGGGFTDIANGGDGSDRLVLDHTTESNPVQTAASPPAGFDGQINVVSEAANTVRWTSVEHFTITTGSHNDNIITGSGDDIVTLNGGADFADVGSGTNQADGGSGSDGISVDMSAASEAVLWNLAANSYSGPAGTSFANFEYFGTLSTGNGDDVIVGTAVQQNETFNLGDGDDSVSIGGGGSANGSDIVNGGAGSDRLIVDLATENNAVQTAASPPAGFDGQINVVGEGANTIRWTSVEHFTITTGTNNDNITTGAGDDIVTLNGGADFADVGAGSNQADGGSGSDGISVDMSAASEAVLWNLAANSYAGPAGTSFASFEYFGTLSTGDGDDVIVGTAVQQNETFNLGDGDDSVSIGGGGSANGSDIVDGGAGSDRLIVDLATENNAVQTAASPPAGFDGQINVVGEGANTIRWTSVEHFTITSGANNDNVTTGSGDDIVTLNGGNDFANVGAGNNQADGGIGIDGISVDMSGATGAVLWNLAANTYSGPAGTGFTNFEYFGTLSTGSGDDVIAGSGVMQSETFNLGGGDDVISIGNGGQDNGQDSVDGGVGEDRLIIDLRGENNSVQSVAPTGGYEGQISVPFETHFVRWSGIEHLTVRGGGAGDIVTGGTGDDVLEGYGGLDQLNGADGDDRLDGGSGNDTLTGGAGEDVFFAGTGNDVMNGDAGDDIFNVVSGQDSANGGADSDTLVADYSAQTVRVSNGGSLPTSNAGGGWDGELTTLPAGGSTRVVFTSIEHFRITTGSGNDILTTRDGNDILSTGAGTDSVNAGAGNDEIDGGSGDDNLTGGTGNDVYVVDSAGDTVIENALEGTDEIRTGLSAYSLGALANLENLTGTSGAGQTLTGNNGDNVITGAGGQDTLAGNDGADRLDGGAGIDRMVGGDGDDIYYVDHTADRAVETAAGNGTDLVIATAGHRLGRFVENLVLAGTGAINGTGNSDINQITGNASANVLNGLTGADVMSGGGGNDTYVVDDENDQAVEAAGGGSDLVKSFVDFTLGDHVENLLLVGSDEIDATGNGLANILQGNDAANRLDGGAGADRMIGNGGDDFYVVDQVGDIVREVRSGDGTDTVESAVDYTLERYVENLTLAGTAANGTGNAHANVITGNSQANLLKGMTGNDALNGGLGDDQLHGGAGHDDLTGGGGADGFRFDSALNAATNVDDILDFTSGEDAIFLNRGVFGKMAAGELAAGAFQTGSAATEADDRILYDSATGELFFDADGNGAGAAILFATVTPGTALNSTDFVVYF